MLTLSSVSNSVVLPPSLIVSFKNHQQKWAWSQEQSLTKWIRTPRQVIYTNLCHCHKQFSDEKEQHFISKCICVDVKLSSCALHSLCVFKTIVPNLNCSKRLCTLYTLLIAPPTTIAIPSEVLAKLKQNRLQR